MLLRASSQLNNEQANLDSIVQGSDTGSGVSGGDQLTAYAEAALGDDSNAIALAREQVRSKLGDPATVDAAGVIANFQRMVRIADSTGIALDEPVMMMSQGIRDDLKLNEFEGASNSPKLPFLKRIMGKIAAPFLPIIFKRIAAKRLGTRT